MVTDRDPSSDPWAAYDELMRRCSVLEEIAERLAVTSADPIAAADFWEWKEASENRSQGPGWHP